FSFQRINGNADSTTAILPAYNWTNNGANTIPDADPISALETSAPAAGAFNSSNNIFTAAGGTIDITSGGGQAVPVTIAANSTLQEVRDDINSANAGVKAQVVNVGTGAAQDFRLVIASDTA